MDESMKLPEPFTCRDCVHFKRCGWLVGVKGDEPHCDWAPSRFRLDTIGTLARLIDEAGATLTLYGQPVTGDQLRDYVTTIAVAKLAAAAADPASPTTDETP